MKKTIYTLLVFLAPAMVHGQQPVRMTIGQAIDKTLSDNPEIGAIRYEERAAMQERKAAAGLRFPSIGVTGAYAHLGDDIGIDLNKAKDPIADVAGQLGSTLGGLNIPIPPSLTQTASQLLGLDWTYVLQERDLATVGGTITVPVFTGGKINAAVKAARINEQTVYSKSDATRNSLVSNVVDSYYALLLAQNVVEVRRKVLEAVDKYLFDARALEENGMIARSERLYIEVKHLEAERDLMSAEIEVQNAMNVLQNLLNTDEPVSPVSDIFYLSNIQNVDYFIGNASTGSPVLRQVELKKELALQGVRLQKSEFFPQVALLGAGSFYRWNTSGAIPKWAVGAGVSFKIFDGLKREYKFSAAKNTVRQVESLQQKAEDEVTLLIRTIYDEMVKCRNKIPSLDKSIEFAEEYRRVKAAAFQAGASTSVDLIDAELNLALSRIEKVTAAYIYDVYLSRLLEITGRSGDFTSYAASSAAIPVRFEVDGGTRN